MKCRNFVLTLGILLTSLCANAVDPINDWAGEPDATSVILKWTPYSGAQTVTEYRVKRNGIAVGSTIGRYGYFTDSGLSPNTIYAYVVEGLGINGNIICQSNAINVSTTSHSTIKTHYKLLAIVFNPNAVLQSELNHIRTFLKYRLDFLRYATHNSVNLDIYHDDIISLNALPPLEPNSTFADYKQLATTSYSELNNNNLVDLIERYDIDIVWVLGAPQGYDFGENILMGNKNLGKDTWISTKVKCSRAFFIHSNLPDARAFDAATHHVEGTMTSATDKDPVNWPRDKEYLVYTGDRSDYSVYTTKLHLFGQFRLTDEWNGAYVSKGSANNAYASKGNANCGSSHFVPGSIRSSVKYPDYTYYDIEAWQRYVDCFADDWLNYPQFSGQSRKINGYDYGAFNNYQENNTTHPFGFGTASFHLWWFNHIPHNPGVNDGKLNNWWPYIYDCNRFDGSAIHYAVDGFPVIPTGYNTNNDEYGTEENTADLWEFWHTNTDFGQRADISAISKTGNSEYVKSGQFATKVDIDVESFSFNGRNDLIYPRFKNAHWQFSDIDLVTFSVKFADQHLIKGTNPIIRLCKNGNNRIEFVPKSEGKYTNFFNNSALKDSDGWYTFRIPVSGNDSWERNVIGYIDPALSPADQEQIKQQLIKSILEDVNYFEISIQSDGGRGESLVYYIDNIKVQSTSVAILNFEVVNISGKVLMNLNHGDKINIKDPAFKQINIIANTNPKKVGSVVFDLNGKKGFRTENVFPYTLGGDTPPGNYFALDLPLGDYQLTATPYTEANGKGEVGIPRTITFTIIDSQVVSACTLINADTDQDIMELKDGDVIHLKEIGTANLNVRANTSPQKVGSVVFDLNDKKGFRTENVFPYALAGDSPPSDYLNWVVAPGKYTITASPYTEKDGKGMAGLSRTITFEVVDDIGAMAQKSQVTEKKAKVSGPATASIAIDFTNDPFPIEIYPNPVENELYVKINEQVGSNINILVTIKNIQGQVVYTDSYFMQQPYSYNISTFSLQPGIYFLQTLSSNGFRKVVKFIKQ